jgi:hypothetical protein
LENLPNKRFSDMLKISGVHPEEPQLVVIDKSKDSKDAKGRVFFKITTIGENRIEVSSGYTGNVFVAFSETLLMIVKTYNESGEPIVHYHESKILPNNSSLEKINSDEQEIRVIDIKGNVNGSILISGNNNQVNINQSTQEPIG